MTTLQRQVEAKREEFNFELKCLLAVVEKRAKEQFEHNVDSNLPSGVVAIDDLAINALQRGIVGGCAYLHQWDTVKTVDIATDILEDSNCHTEAKALWKAAGRA